MRELARCGGMAMGVDRSRLDSVRNAARVLKQFSYHERQLGVSELARRLGLGKSTAHRLVSTLKAEHLLEQDPETGKYRLGLAVYDLAAAVSTNFAMHEAAVPPMAQLGALHGHGEVLARIPPRAAARAAPRRMGAEGPHAVHHHRP